MMEYWSDGFRGEKNLFFQYSGTPILHHSIILKIGQYAVSRISSRIQESFKSLRGADGDEAISLKANKNTSLNNPRLLRGVYPEALEGLAMTSGLRLNYAKNFWDATLV